MAQHLVAETPAGAAPGGMHAQQRLSLALFWWMGAAVFACCVAASAGADRAAAAVAAALALSPAVATLILLSRWGETWAQVLSIFSWLSFAVVAVALTGGAQSPAISAFLLGPAVSLWSGQRERVVEATLFALLAFVAAVAAGALVALETAPFALGPLGSFLGAFGVAFGGGLMAAHPWRRAQAGRPAHADTPPPQAPPQTPPQAPPQAPTVAPDIAPAALPLASAAPVAELSHELRTPLTHIIGFAELMERQVFGPLHDRYREYAGVIRSSGAHLLGLVNDMLDLSRLEEGQRKLELERFDARDIAREVTASARPSADQKGVQLVLDTPAAPLTCDADARAVRQILFNIVSNAVKFSPSGGAARLALRRKGRTLLLEMADSGPGIPEAERAVLGERFVRGASGARVEGVGLGLAIVKGLAGLHGGALSFDAAPEGGALVRISLPVLVDDEA